MSTLEELRKDIDALDNHLLEIIQKRLTLMKATGEAKKKNGLPVRDTKREEEIRKSLEQKGNEIGVPINLIKNIWNVFFEASAEIEK